MRVLGIDFGTSNTVAMLRTTDARMRPLLFDGSPLLPSAIYLNTDGKILIGRDAERNARVDPSRFEPNPKRRIDDGDVFLADQIVPVPRLFGYVLSQVSDEARRQLGAAPDEVRLTHPARWGERRRSLLLEAARTAGLGTPRLIAEPVGAASYFTSVLGSGVPVGRSLAIYDLGGGTFDATVVRRTQTGFEVLAEDGLADVGGLDFDHAIVEHLGRVYAQSHPAEWASLANPTDSADRRLRRLLYEDVRGAKEMLSRTSSTDIHLPALEIDAHLTREELESLVRPYLEQTVQTLQRAIGSAKLAPADLVGIFLVGGSSRIPLAAHLIHSELGVAPTTLEQPETVVVEGALCIGAPTNPDRTSGIPRVATPPPPQQQARPISGVPVSPSPISGAGVAPMSGGPAGHRMPPRPPVQQQPMQRPPLAPQRPPIQPAQPMQQRPPVPQPVQQQRPPLQQQQPVQQQRPPVLPQGRPVMQPPVMQPPVQQRPPVPQQPMQQRPPMPQPQARPVTPAPQGGWQQQPAPRPGPFPPAPRVPVVTPSQDTSSDRRWAGATIAILVVVAVAFIVLIIILAQ